MKINIVFDYPSKGYGIHTAFANHLSVMKGNGKFDVRVNSIKAADICHVHTIGPLSLFNTLHKSPFIYTYHMTMYEAQYLKMPIGFVSGIMDYVIGRASVVVAPSPFCKNEVKSNKPVAVISNGVDMKSLKKSRKRRKEFRERFGIGGSDTVVYGIGMLAEKKGIGDFGRLAEAGRKNGIKFVWVGRSFANINSLSIEELRKKYPSVIFTGYIEKISDIHSAGDVLLFPSYHEILGIPVLEAAACGNPVVVRDIPTFDRWLAGGKNCMKFSDEKTMAGSINEIISNKSLRKKIARNGFATAKKHDIKSLAKFYERLYDLCHNGEYEEAGCINSYE